MTAVGVVLDLEVLPDQVEQSDHKVHGEPDAHSASQDTKIHEVTWPLMAVAMMVIASPLVVLFLKQVGYIVW